MKNLLEVLRFFPLLNLGGKKSEKNLQAGFHVTSKSAVVPPHESNYHSQNFVMHFPLSDFHEIGTFVHFIGNIVTWKKLGRYLEKIGSIPTLLSEL